MSRKLTTRYPMHSSHHFRFQEGNQAGPENRARTKTTMNKKTHKHFFHKTVPVFFAFFLVILFMCVLLFPWEEFPGQSQKVVYVLGLFVPQTKRCTERYDSLQDTKRLFDRISHVSLVVLLKQSCGTSPGLGFCQFARQKVASFRGKGGLGFGFSFSSGA